MASMDVKCPLCGTINYGVNLEETEGWVECSGCKTDFIPPEYLHKEIKNTVSLRSSIIEVNLKIKVDLNSRAL